MKDPQELLRDAERLLRAGQARDAESMLERAVNARPRVAACHQALGKIRLQLNRPGEALFSFECCVLLEPGERAHRMALVRLYQTRVFTSYSEISALAMLTCLADESLTHSSMERAWLSLLRVDPAAAPIIDLFDGAGSYEEFRTGVSAALLETVQAHVLFRAGLRRLVVADVAIERGLTFLRRWLAAQERQTLSRFLPLLCELARYCFVTEYVFDVHENVSALRRDLSTPVAVALLACYETLNDLYDLDGQEVARVAGLSAEPCYTELIRTWLEEPLEERVIRTQLPTLSPISDETSRAVRAQYEESPYPRWTTVGGALSHAEGMSRLRGQGKRILSAGCGTGREAVELALNFPAAVIDAVDLSRASLAHGLRKARAAGLSNVSFAQADLLALGGHAERYDFISAVGVLHHLREPLEGLDVLVSLLRPGGVLRVALYSRIAREPVARARAFIASAGLAATPAGIRAFRAAIIAGPADDPERAWLTRSPDFYSLSQCRDLVFHVHEHRFSLPEIAALLRARGLSVFQVAVMNPLHLATYRLRFPDDPAATRLENWDELERENATLFSGMYDLWLHRTVDQPAVDPSWLDVAE